MRSTLRPVLTGILLVAFLSTSWAAAPLRVEMVEFKFRPAVIRVQAGRLVTLRLVNRGQIAHQFETVALRGVPITVANDQLDVEAPGLDVVRLQPGTSATVQFLPRQRGRFPIVCTIEGHREAGMEGILEVR
ncbi:MAG: cupredoxin domain-containing protein [Armatimonadetes bacterium]|nr:cupredoxin domain-containing protein [Armatimonadota bacterium]